MLRILCAKTLICEMFLLKKDVKMTMRALQKNSQNVRFSMFQKTKKERKNQNRNKNKIYILRDGSEENFNCNDFLARFNFKKHDNLNKKEHETKSKQIVERTSF